MTESRVSIESELMISPVPILAVLFGTGLAAFLGTQLISLPWDAVNRSMSLYLLYGSLAVIGWLVVRLCPLVGRWFTILALLVAVHFANTWLDLPEVLTLVAIPVALAAPLISMRATVLTAAVESVFLVGVLWVPAARVNEPGVFVATVAMWAMAAVMRAAYHPIRQLSGWLDEYFGRAQRFLEEARDGRADLELALESLSHANRQLLLANERTAALRRIAEDAQRAKTAFVANVSHEFRTPLNMILGLVELMVETPKIYTVVLPPEMREDLQVVYRNCVHLSNMINDVLDMTRMETGRLSLHRERVDLRAVVENCLVTVRPLVEKKHLAVRIEVPDALGQVYCDATRIQQVILNLVSNAARFTETGGITVRAVGQQQLVLVSVADTGPGITPEDAERVFEPFSQGSGSLWRDKGGSGLGLSISKQFVRLHGGRMWLESEVGVGTTFFFTLPVAPPIEHIAEPGHMIRKDWVWRTRAFRTERAVQADQLVKPRVLICDRTGILQSAFARYSDPVEFVETRSLEQAAEELEKCPAHVLLVNATGSDVPAQLADAAAQVASGTPVVACSVSNPVESALEAGASGYLTKPVSRSDFGEVLQAIGRPVKRVLLVDDEPDVLKLFTRLLRVRHSDIEVFTASSGRQALDELHSAVPDLVLLDIVLPDMSGWEVLRRIRTDETIADIPVVVVSAQDPTDQPFRSSFLVATTDRGLVLDDVLRCSLAVSQIMLGGGRGSDPVLG